MSDPMIAYCGLVCTECPAFLATQAGDEKKAQATADLWSRQFHHTLALDDVWCDGCLVGGKKCAHCAVCSIRACAQNRGVKNCGHCDEYCCEELGKFLQVAPNARKTLERIRQEIKTA